MAHWNGLLEWPKKFFLYFSLPFQLGVCIHWTGLLDSLKLAKALFQAQNNLNPTPTTNHAKTLAKALFQAQNTLKSLHG